MRRLAESHGGQVGVRTVPGEGSAFWFELPRARSAPPGRPDRLAAPAGVEAPLGTSAL